MTNLRADEQAPPDDAASWRFVQHMATTNYYCTSPPFLIASVHALITDLMLSLALLGQNGFGLTLFQLATQLSEVSILQYLRSK